MNGEAINGCLRCGALLPNCWCAKDARDGVDRLASAMTIDEILSDVLLPAITKLRREEPDTFKKYFSHEAMMASIRKPIGKRAVK
jgi:hypothetical protein